MPSPLQHQEQCLKAIHKTIQQLHQHLKAEQLNRKTLQYFVLQLQNDNTILRYLLFSTFGTILINDTSVKKSAISPAINPNTNLNINPNPTSNSLLFPRADEPTVRRSTPEGAVGPPRVKLNNSANVDFQSQTTIRDGPLTTVQNLSSRISQLEKLFTDEIATYTTITTGIFYQYFLLYNKIRQLKAGTSDTIISKIPSVKFVFDSTKVARPSSDPLTQPATSFSSPIFRTHPHGCNIFVKFYPYGNGRAAGKSASIIFTLFTGDSDNLLQYFNGPSRSSSTLVTVIK